MFTSICSIWWKTSTVIISYTIPIKHSVFSPQHRLVSQGCTRGGFWFNHNHPIFIRFHCILFAYLRPYSFCYYTQSSLKTVVNCSIINVTVNHVLSHTDLFCIWAKNRCLPQVHMWHSQKCPYNNLIFQSQVHFPRQITTNPLAEKSDFISLNVAFK